MRKNSLIILALVLLSFLTLWPLVQKGFFPVHDDTQVARVFEMKKALLAGEFPVRWVPDLGYGYGYPIFNFYAPLAYYVGAFFALLGIPALPATKIMIGIGMMLAVVGMYLFARQFLSKTASFISALLYMYAPYHAVNLYVRGAVAELWAYALVPFTFYGFYQLYVQLTEGKEQRAKNKELVWLWIAVAAVSYAGVILSHNLTALMVTPFLIVYLLVLSYRFMQQRNLSALRSLLFALILGVLLSAFYWLPALTEMKYTNVVSVTGGGSQYKDHFVCLSQLWSSQWGYGGSAPGCLDGLSFQLGKLHILLGALSLLAFFFARKKQKDIFVFAVFGTVVSISMLLPYSKPVWDSLSFMKYIQFPWRYLGLTTFFLSFLAGYTVWVAQDRLPKKHNQNIIAGIIIVVLSLGMFVLYGKYFKPQMIIANYRDETDLTILRWTISKISDEYLPPHFARPTSAKDVATARIVDPLHRTMYDDRLASVQAVTNSPEPTTLQVNIAVFPFWKFYQGPPALPNKPSITPQVQAGSYRVTIPAGVDGTELVIRFRQTPIEVLANSLSLIGLLGLILGIILQFLKTNAKTS